VFEVNSPYGHVFQVTCRRRASMGVREISEISEASAPKYRTGCYGESADSIPRRPEHELTLQDISGRLTTLASKSCRHRQVSRGLLCN
jgi:hypothetical protein